MGEHCRDSRDQNLEVGIGTDSVNLVIGMTGSYNNGARMIGGRRGLWSG